ncbi:unnamed protein product [Cyclocybe aegerita]|uniref:Uncharacterized protein n=1 Tax=Cyclocybe aegerita TaxID=1973307 RepID=A0A8S0WCF1_CYCAE|nr:unnamed protein product [Cyclocybe aegerita]
MNCIHLCSIYFFHMSRSRAGENYFRFVVLPEVLREVVSFEPEDKSILEHEQLDALHDVGVVGRETATISTYSTTRGMHEPSSGFISEMKALQLLQWISEDGQGVKLEASLRDNRLGGSVKPPYSSSGVIYIMVWTDVMIGAIDTYVKPPYRNNPAHKRQGTARAGPPQPLLLPLHRTIEAMPSDSQQRRTGQALEGADFEHVHGLENKLDNLESRYEAAPDNAHLDIDSKDERSLANRAAASEKHELEKDAEKASKTVTDPLAPARAHGNEPSRGAKIDAQIQSEEGELLRKKNN